MDRGGKGAHMSKRLAIALLCLVPFVVAAQTDFSKVEIRTTKLSDTLYMLAGAGGNIGLSVGEDAVFLIDDQYAPLTPKISAEIAKITPKPVKFVLNTHWHDDHTGGNENLGRTGALIVAHENVRKRMSVEQFIEAFNLKVQPSAKAALPVVTFAGAVTFYLNGDEIRAIHVPNAHTDGDAIVHFVANDVVHMGDVYFNGMYPFIDTSSGGSVGGVIAAVDKVLAAVTDKTRVIPGHGPLSNKAELKAYRDMLADLSAQVREMLGAGKSAADIVAANPTARYEDKYGKGFIKGPKFAEMLAKDLMRK
jgi:glyoxylase-like metal-dependent hydrolase (beta-lactamase superfamily II)